METRRAVRKRRRALRGAGARASEVSGSIPRRDVRDVRDVRHTFLKNGSYAFSKGYLNTPELKKLRKSAAAELDLSVEELDRMLAKEIKQLAKEQKLINIE